MFESNDEKQNEKLIQGVLGGNIPTDKSQIRTTKCGFRERKSIRWFNDHSYSIVDVSFPIVSLALRTACIASSRIFRFSLDTLYVIMLHKLESDRVIFHNQRRSGKYLSQRPNERTRKRACLYVSAIINPRVDRNNHLARKRSVSRSRCEMHRERSVYLHGFCARTSLSMTIGVSARGIKKVGVSSASRFRSNPAERSFAGAKRGFFTLRRRCILANSR